MTRRRYSPLLAALLLCALLLAACGSSSSSSNSSSAPAPGAQTAPAGTSSTSSSSSTVPSTKSGSSSDVQAAVEECKQIIKVQTKLPAGAKEKLENACLKAAHGDTAAVKKAAQEVCEEVIDSSAVPNGSAKEAAVASCKK